MNRKKKLCCTANGDLKEKSREGAGAVVDAYLTPPVRDIDWLGNRQTSPFDATKKKKISSLLLYIFLTRVLGKVGIWGGPCIGAPPCSSY